MLSFIFRIQRILVIYMHIDFTNLRFRIISFFSGSDSGRDLSESLFKSSSDVG